ncbi:hypothetical protein HYE67_002996 [Fusarium culmorum]|uniref:Baeyer-Villiger monooxygenase n=1 Tax=Fusarium culmorum TaxID=5516 RepID=A0A7S8D2T1_FUSCU|nr:hypothetical protein HYE67_002996 [Fusarium culmorum]
MAKQGIHEPRPMRVICIGAGISGIAAAYKAQRQLVNTELIVYEKNHDEGNPKWSRFKWQWPDIPGLESFKGKRVVVIGAGSSALQIVPTIQPVVSQLTNFIRSPTWITAEYGQAFASEGRETRFTEEQIKLFQSDKWALLEYRRKLLDVATKGFDIYYKDTDMQKQAFIANRKLMRERLQDNEEICSKLIPDFEVGCRRVSPGNGYLESLIKPNTKAIFDGIKCVNESGILDNNNIQHDFDIIICATGFDVSHRPAFPVLGCGGQNLRDVWSQGPTHYLSVAAPGFPNYWIAGGPNAPISNMSLIMGLELAVDYAFSCVRKMQAEGIASLEVEEDAAKELM